MSFLKFERMITPVFIQIMFWVGFLGSFIAGLGLIGYGIISSSGGFLEILIGIGVLFVGPLMVRIYCELLIVVFKMHGSLLDIRSSISNGPDEGVRSFEGEEEVI